MLFHSLEFLFIFKESCWAIFLPIHRSAWTASPLLVRLLFILLKKAFSVIDFGIAKLESLLISLHFFWASSQVAVSWNVKIIVLICFNYWNVKTIVLFFLIIPRKISLILPVKASIVYPESGGHFRPTPSRSTKIMVKTLKLKLYEIGKVNFLSSFGPKKSVPPDW